MLVRYLVTNNYKTIKKGNSNILKRVQILMVWVQQGLQDSTDKCSVTEHLLKVKMQFK